MSKFLNETQRYLCNLDLKLENINPSTPRTIWLVFTINCFLLAINTQFQLCTKFI